MSNEDKPKEGDRFHCQECDMELLVTQPCKCEDDGPFLSCCGKQMELRKSGS